MDTRRSCSYRVHARRVFDEGPVEALPVARRGVVERGREPAEGEVEGLARGDHIAAQGLFLAHLGAVHLPGRHPHIHDGGDAHPGSVPAGAYPLPANSVHGVGHGAEGRREGGLLGRPGAGDRETGSESGHDDGRDGARVGRRDLQLGEVGRAHVSHPSGESWRAGRRTATRRRVGSP